MNLPSLFRQTLSTHGLIAILRGLRPDGARDIGLALHGAGIRLIEVVATPSKGRGTARKPLPCSPTWTRAPPAP